MGPLTRAAPAEHSRMPAISATGQLSQPAEQQHLAISRLEPPEGDSEQRLIVAGGGFLVGAGRIVRHLGEVGEIGRFRPSGGPAKVVRGAAPGEMVHPSRKAAGVAVGVPAFQHALENGLGDVLRGQSAPGQLNEKTEQGTVAPFAPDVEFAERAPRASSHGRRGGRRFPRSRPAEVRTGEFRPGKRISHLPAIRPVIHDRENPIHEL